MTRLRIEPRSPGSLLNTLLNGSNKYTTERNEFDTLQEITETFYLNDEYENFVIAHIEEAEEYILTKPNSVEFHGKTLAVTKKRDNVKTVHTWNSSPLPSNLLRL